eukprot:TRINITY_DN25495_c0_g1_i1.p1 TRINITY_DN25495_c0_g1~~TRINITY_DN25495_c0_g1_i1.p1  ORF type:complete len:161 (-),score=12.34 TRINITY_DN25495_c0_g1_i1:264-746(-)
MGRSRSRSDHRLRRNRRDKRRSCSRSCSKSPSRGKRTKGKRKDSDSTRSAPKGVEVMTMKAGDGKNYPKEGDKLLMHYTGTLASNGKKFDSSRGKGKPFSFRVGVGQVIRGWDEGIMKMSLGEKATLKISADFGYGSEGVGGSIPPNADLVFEVELLKIN